MCFNDETMPSKKINPRLSGSFAKSLDQRGRPRSVRVGHKNTIYGDLYHSLLSLTWASFLRWVLGYYLSINFLFALVYFACGPDALKGAAITGPLDHFIDCFFFSVQTFATIGYGHITPYGIIANSVVTIEALIGLLTVALATGLVFARFSRPTAKVIFSNRAVISLIDGVPCFVLRVGNERKNQIVEAKVYLTLIRTEVTAEGETYRNLIDLPLERSSSPIFAASWTIVHEIDPKSPLHGMTLERMNESNSELFVSIVGIDDIFGQTIHARHSYVPEDIAWNRYFEDILHWDEKGTLHINMGKIHDLKPVV